MIDSKPLMLSVLLVSLGLPACIIYDHATRQSDAKPIVLYHEPSYSPDMQRELMDALDSVPRERLMKAIETVESHGNPNAVSPKGAKGRYQIMDGTAKKPGLGVQPIRNHSQREQKRFATAYLNALLSKYRKLAIASYNGGTGAADRALAKADRALAMMPLESRDYVAKVEKQLAENEE